MGKVLGIENNRFPVGRAQVSPSGMGSCPDQPLSGECTDGVALARLGSESDGGQSKAALNLHPLAALAADAAIETDIAKLFGTAAEIAAMACSLRRVLVLATDYPDDTTPVYAGVGWNAKEQRRVVRRLKKRASGLEQIGRPVPATSQSIRTEACTSFESGILKKWGHQRCLVTVAGSGQARVMILADCQGTRDAQKAQARDFLVELAGVLGLAVARASMQGEVSSIDARVRRAKIQWEDAVDVLPQLICVLDRFGKVIRVNRTLEAWGLGSVKSAPGRTMHELLHPRCRDPDCALKRACRSSWREVGDQGLTRLEVSDPVLGRELLVGALPNRKDRSDLEPGSFGFLIIEDVTERKIAEQMLEHFNQELQRRVQQKTGELDTANQELRCIIDEHCRDRRALEESQQKYTNFVENTLTGIYLLEDGRITFCNSRFAALLGYTKEELTGKKIAELVLPVESVMRTELAGTGWADDGGDALAGEQLCSGVTKKGKQIWLKTSRAQIAAHGEPLIVGNVVDVTEQIDAETVLIRSERELRDLSAQLITAQEEERQRIAGELHDGIGQQLSVIKFGVERVLEAVGGQIPPEQEDELGAVVARVRQTIEEVRRVSMDLRPSILDDLGLVSTIDWFSREFQQMEPKLAIHKNVKIREGDIPGDLKVAIFRILQEACNNVHKYANASLVSIKLAKHEDKISFSVSDDGVGFDYGRLAKLGKGFGLGSMKQRVKLTGGKFRLSSAKGLGTRIEAEWPLERRQRPTRPFSIA